MLKVTFRRDNLKHHDVAIDQALTGILGIIGHAGAGHALALTGYPNPAVAALGDIAEQHLPSGSTSVEDLTPCEIQPVFTAYLAASLDLDLDIETKEPAHAVWHARPFA